MTVPTFGVTEDWDDSGAAKSGRPEGLMPPYVDGSSARFYPEFAVRIGGSSLCSAGGDKSR
jgi:hypothetical protein